MAVKRSNLDLETEIDFRGLLAALHALVLARCLRNDDPDVARFHAESAWLARQCQDPLAGPLLLARSCSFVILFYSILDDFHIMPRLLVYQVISGIFSGGSFIRRGRLKRLKTLETQV